MNKLISFFVLPVFITIISFFGLYLVSIFQVKRDYENLDFIPENSNFVVRIDMKDISKNLFKEWIQSGYKPEIPLTKKDTLNLKNWAQFNSIDLSYPIYLFSKKLDKSPLFITVISLNDESSFVNSLPKDKEWSKYVFTHNQKGFIVSQCNDQDFKKIQEEIKKSNSSKWKPLLNSKDLISFQTDYLDLKGKIEIDNNKFSFDGKFTNPPLFFNSSQYSLKPAGFHASATVPFSNISSILTNYVPKSSIDLSWLSKCKSISMNYFGIKSPYNPQFQLLLNTRDHLDVSGILSNYSIAQLDEDKSKLKIAGMSFNFYQNDDFIYIGNKGFETSLIERTNNIVNLEGDPKVLVNFDEAPLVKMLLLLNSQFSSANNFISKTRDFLFQISPNSSENTCNVKCKLEMEKSVFILTEIFDLALNM